MRVAVAMSGGVDSSVAAALLQAQGHEVVGVTLQQWPRDDMEESAKHGGGCAFDAVEGPRPVGRLLGVSFYCWSPGEGGGAGGSQRGARGTLRGRQPHPPLGATASRAV